MSFLVLIYLLNADTDIIDIILGDFVMFIDIAEVEEYWIGQ